MGRGHRLHRAAVILAGGEGKRLWPATTEAEPKQFLRLFGGTTLLEQTWRRALSAPGVKDVWVVTRELYARRTRAVLPQLPPERLIVEPSGKTTGPALALAPGLIARELTDAAILVLPADHYIPDERAFASSADLALRVAEENRVLVTFAIQPTRPETGYGYMELGGPSLDGMIKVRRFGEKPDPGTAQTFLEAGNYAWNGGMFAWRNSTLAAALQATAPALYENVYLRALHGGEDWRAEWDELPSISVDHAVMEHAKNIVATPVTFAWDDLGSWMALERNTRPDKDGSVVVRGPVFLDDCFPI